MVDGNLPGTLLEQLVDVTFQTGHRRAAETAGQKIGVGRRGRIDLGAQEPVVDRLFHHFARPAQVPAQNRLADERGQLPVNAIPGQPLDRDRQGRGPHRAVEAVAAGAWARRQAATGQVVGVGGSHFPTNRAPHVGRHVQGQRVEHGFGRPQISAFRVLALHEIGALEEKLRHGDGAFLEPQLDPVPRSARRLERIDLPDGRVRIDHHPLALLSSAANPLLVHVRQRQEGGDVGRLGRQLVSHDGRHVDHRARPRPAADRPHQDHVESILQLDLHVARESLLQGCPMVDKLAHRAMELVDECVVVRIKRQQAQGAHLERAGELAGPNPPQSLQNLAVAQIEPPGQPLVILRALQHGASAGHAEIAELVVVEPFLFRIVGIDHQEATHVGHPQPTHARLHPPQHGGPGAAEPDKQHGARRARLRLFGFS